MQLPHDQSAAFVIFGPGSEWFWAMAQFFGVSATLLLILRQIILQGQATALAAFTAVQEQWNSPSLVAARARVSLAALAGIRMRGNAPRAVATFFEEVGLHVRRGLINIDDVWERFSVSAEIYWKIMSDAVLATRRTTGDDTWYANFEYLVYRLQHHAVHREKRGFHAFAAKVWHRPVQHCPAKTLLLTPDDLRFCELECEKDGAALWLGRADLPCERADDAPRSE